MYQIGEVTLCKAQEVYTIGGPRALGHGKQNTNYPEVMVETSPCAQTPGLAPRLGIVERKCVIWAKIQSTKKEDTKYLSIIS